MKRNEPKIRSQFISVSMIISVVLIPIFVFVSVVVIFVTSSSSPSSSSLFSVVLVYVVVIVFMQFAICSNKLFMFYISEDGTIDPSLMAAIWFNEFLINEHDEHGRIHPRSKRTIKFHSHSPDVVVETGPDRIGIIGQVVCLSSRID